MYTSVDIDECAMNNGGCKCGLEETKDNCEAICMNSDGHFECSCPDGYILGDDRLTCQGT